MTKHEIEMELLAVVAFIWLAFATLLNGFLRGETHDRRIRMTNNLKPFTTDR